MDEQQNVEIFYNPEGTPFTRATGGQANVNLADIEKVERLVPPKEFFGEGIRDNRYLPMTHPFAQALKAIIMLGGEPVDGYFRMVFDIHELRALHREVCGE